MAFIMGAMAAGFATAEMTQTHRAGEQIGGNVETSDEIKLALTKASGLGPLGRLFIGPVYMFDLVV